MFELSTISESEEMYLVTMARIQEAGSKGAIPLSELAERLDILPVSVNQMVRKLQEAGLVDYIPYKGVEFTSKGQARALQILRHHRLWEIFLVECLKISLAEADELADRMEHILPSGAAERLASFLGNPSHSPSGHQIPEPDAQELFPAAKAITEMQLGEIGLVAEIPACANTRAFLASQGISPGGQITMLAKGQKGEVLLQAGGNQSLYLSEQLAQSITYNDLPAKPGKDD